MLVKNVEIDMEKIHAFAIRHGVARLSLFGSALREDSSARSDIDLLVEFLPDRRVSLFDIGGMMMELSDMLGRQVDLRTPMDLSRHFRDDVLRSAVPVYAA